MGKLKAGILGARGEVGQRFTEYLVKHPYFEINSLYGSDQTRGLTYGQASGRSDLPQSILEMKMKSVSKNDPIDIEDDTLVLEFYYPFHKEKIENPKYRRMVERKLSETFGTPNKISCVLKEKSKKRAMEGHLVRAALEAGGRVTSVEEK